MRPTNYVPGPSALLAAAIALVAPVIAQKDQSKSSQKETPSPTPSATPSATGQESKAKSPSATPTPTPTPTGDKSKTDTSSDSGGVITPTGSLNTADPTGQPSITGGPQATSGDELTGFPTLTGPGLIPTYPAPSVPPTKDAPFMQQSTLPDGTVFIAVGSILGAMGLAVLLWRGIVSFLLHRSVKRAAMAQHSADTKTGFPAPPAPFYKYTDQASTMSLGGGAGGAAAAAGRGVRRTNRGPIPSSTPSQSNLFFSPTAGTGAAGNRGSSFLPSGFYAAGNSSPGGQGNQTNSISLNNLHPDSRGYYANANASLSRNTLNISPPESPHVGARSLSSLNVSLGPGQRAPSAYLDDLLMDDPSALPPPHMPPSAGPSRTGSPATASRF